MLMKVCPHIRYWGKLMIMILTLRFRKLQRGLDQGAIGHSYWGSWRLKGSSITTLSFRRLSVSQSTKQCSMVKSLLRTSVTCSTRPWTVASIQTAHCPLKLGWETDKGSTRALTLHRERKEDPLPPAPAGDHPSSRPNLDSEWLSKSASTERRKSRKNSLSLRRILEWKMTDKENTS